MIKNLVSQWESNKSDLENYFKNTPQSEYGSYQKIVEKLFEFCLKQADDFNGFNVGCMTVIDDGDYQGTKIFIVPFDTYQPSETQYVVTHTGYGSCSGCDTLQAINEYGDELPSESQVSQYMTLALHLVQKMKRLYAEE